MEKRNKWIYWISTGWLALGMVSTGIVQLMRAKEGQGGADMINHLGYPAYMLTLLGVCKILGVIVLLIPRYPVLKEWVYAGFVFMMSGALYSHIATGDAAKDLFPSFLLLLLILTSWYFRPVGRRIVLANR
ncbi:MAG: DoxX family protein [Flavisolibacter sp.]